MTRIRLLLFSSLLLFYSASFGQQDSAAKKIRNGWYSFGINIQAGIMGDKNFNTFDLASLKQITPEHSTFSVLGPDIGKTTLDVRSDKKARYHVLSGSISFRPPKGGDDYVNDLRIGFSWYTGTGNTLIYTYTDTIAPTKLRTR